MARTQATLLAIGDLAHRDFVAAAQWLSLQTFDHAVDCEQAARYLEAHVPPRWILLFSARRGLWEQKWIERLHRRAPFAHLVHVCGSWCEGEPRSGAALQGVTRVYAHEFVVRAEAAFAKNDDFAGWTLPRATSPADMLLQSRTKTSRATGGELAVIADRHDDFQAIADAIRVCGFTAQRTTAFASVSTTAGVIWNGRSLDEFATAALRRFIVEAAPLPVVALLDFPRQHEIDLAKAIGASAVCSKPLLIGDLRAALARAIHARPKRKAG